MKTFAFVPFLAISLLIPPNISAQTPPAHPQHGARPEQPDRLEHPGRADRVSALAAATEAKRQQLLQHWGPQIRDPQQLQQMESRLAELSPRQVNQLVRQQQALQRQARLHGGHPAAVGFAPVITVLPEGAHLHGGAVISPDRRHVRISAMPFFSTIGPVHTFNWQTGQAGIFHPGHTGPMSGHTGHTGHMGHSGHTGHWPQMVAPPVPSARPPVWHDGLRTRTGARPGR